MTKDPRDRARKLVALAVRNPNPHEAASAAVAACKLIYDESLLDVPAARAAPRAPAAPPSPARAAAPTQRDHARDARLIVSKFFGLCRLCRQSFDAGVYVYWKSGRDAEGHQLIWHQRCWREVIGFEVG